jgi:hypothetical protein
MKFRIYAANKTDKVEKYRKKMQAKYDSIRTSKAPWIICCPVMTYEGKYAVPLAVDDYPEKDIAVSVVDSIDPPVTKEIVSK